MRLLALDTATEACSAALSCDGRVEERFIVAPRRHAELLPGMIDDLLATAGLSPAGLDLVAFGRGPGSFTGLRIAAGVAQGLAWTRDLPVAPVSDLAALARDRLAGRDPGTLCGCAFDARMGQVYWGLFRAGAEGEPAALAPERVCAPEQIPLPQARLEIAAGSGWQAHGAVLGRRLGGMPPERHPDALPRAAAIAWLGERMAERGELVAAERALPVYLRDQVTRPQPDR